MYSDTGSPLSLARFCNSRHSAFVSLSGITSERTSDFGFGGRPIRILIVYQKVRGLAMSLFMAAIVVDDPLRANPADTS